MFKLYHIFHPLCKLIIAQRVEWWEERKTNLNISMPILCLENMEVSHQNPPTITTYPRDHVDQNMLNRVM